MFEQTIQTSRRFGNRIFSLVGYRILQSITRDSRGWRSNLRYSLRAGAAPVNVKRKGNLREIVDLIGLGHELLPHPFAKLCTTPTYSTCSRCRSGVSTTPGGSCSTWATIQVPHPDASCPIKISSGSRALPESCASTYVSNSTPCSLGCQDITSHHVMLDWRGWDQARDVVGSGTEAVRRNCNSQPFHSTQLGGLCGPHSLRTCTSWLSGCRFGVRCQCRLQTTSSGGGIVGWTEWRPQ